MEKLEKTTPEEIARQIKAQQEGTAPTSDLSDPTRQGANVGVEEKK